MWDGDVMARWSDVEVDLGREGDKSGSLDGVCTLMYHVCVYVIDSTELAVK